nr:unnamed protein product [Callosobruchus chinensis]
MCHYTATGSSCVPLVVRPQQIPKPAIALPVNVGLVPGPCTVKKAIVRPAIVPKPTCQAQEKPAYGFGYSEGTGTYSEGKYSGVEGFVNGNVGGGFPSGIGGEVFLGSRAGIGPFVDGGCKPLGAVIEGVGIGDYRIGTPADPVSIAIALKKQAEIENCERAIEDKLSFGFRKIPIELPRKEIIKAALIPEENIHRLNGKVIEFVPPKPGCKSRTLEEEAAEDLLQLEAEEAAVEEAEESRKGPYNNILLEEIGYRPAALRSGSFLDVAAEAVNQAVNAVAGVAAGAAAAAANGASGAGAVGEVVDAVTGAIAGAAGAAANGGIGNNGYLPGNVEYRTLPKIPDAIIFPTTEFPDSCESGEINMETLPKLNRGAGVKCGCVPVLKFNQQAFSHKTQSDSNVFLQKLQL